MSQFMRLLHNLGIKKFLNPFHTGYQQTGTLVNSDDPGELLHKVVFHQGLHCLLS